MRSIPRVAAALIFLVTCVPIAAHADCIEQTRRVQYDDDVGAAIKSYLCSTEQAQRSPQIKVELHDFSNVAASMLVGKISSKVLEKTIGSPRVVENEIFKQYANLLAVHGETRTLHCKEADNDCASMSLLLSGQSFSRDETTVDTLRSIVSSSYEYDYPNLSDVQDLRAKRVRGGMKFYFPIECEDDPLAETSMPATDCRKPGKHRMSFWRAVQPQDLDKYQKELTAYNRLIKAGGSGYRNGQGVRALYASDAEKYLKLAKQVAGDVWPDDFLVLEGGYVGDGCGGLEGLYGWLFKLYVREVELETVLITNVSVQPITLDSLLGRQVASKGLREITESTSPSDTPKPLPFAAQRLEPGDSLLIPTRIVFPASPSLESVFSFSRASDRLFGRLGTNGFKVDRSKYGRPTFKDYAYGPEVAITGASLNGKRVDWSRRDANFTDLVVSFEAGSCPYLLAWDGKNRDWVNYGKVLHRAPSRDREYTQTVAVLGFTSRFRIEEREPEVAFIDHAELTLVLKDGRTIAVPAEQSELAARDQDYLKLLWGEAIEIAFALPSDITEADVAQSRLSVTGYYLRYSRLLSQSDPPRSTPAGIRLGRADTAPVSLLADSAVTGAPLCPVPENLSFRSARPL
jgi:hypothetical protein